MTLSVIMPTLNEAAEVEAAIASALAFGDAEVIVVDGGSTDGTVDRARLAGAALVLTTPPGRALQQNAGADHASGEILLFLHADCRLPRNGWNQLAVAMNDERVVGGCFRQRIDAGSFVYRLLETGNALRARFARSIYGDQGLFVRQATFEALGRFPQVPFLEDWLFSKKLRRAGRLVVLPGQLIVSPRCWKRTGVIRRTLRNWSILRRARRGTPLSELAAEYQNDR